MAHYGLIHCGRCHLTQGHDNIVYEIVPLIKMLKVLWSGLP